MITFYDNDMSTCCQKVRLVLAAKGLDYKRIYMNVRAGDHFTPEYLKLNPAGVLPTIVDDGKPVIESATIISYLEDAYPDPGLSPDSPHACALMLRWMIRPDASLHQACGLTSFALAFRHQLGKLPPEAFKAHMAKMPSEKRRAEITAIVQNGLDAPGVGLAFRTYYKAVEDMNAQLAETKWLAADTWSLADITLVPYVLRLDHLGLSWFWDDKPRVADWYACAKARPEYSAIEAYLDDGYIKLMDAIDEDEHARIKDILQEEN